MATVITHGTLVTASDTFRADVRVDGGQIVEIGRDLRRPGDEVVDAEGLLVMPGGVDPHVHLDLPSAGTRSADSFETGTIAAAFGGTTSVIDFVTPARGESLMAAFEARDAEAKGHSVLDYGFHMSVIEMRPRTLEEMDASMARGMPSFKIYSAYPGVLMLEDAEIFRVMSWAAQHGALVQVHAENGGAITELIAAHAAAGKLQPHFHAATRPSPLEGEATGRVIAMAEVAGAAAYIVHVTCAEALEAVRAARLRGAKVFGETCPQYLYLTEAELSRPDFEGAKFVCSPPLRPASHPPALWRGLEHGDLQVVATDHCPFNFAGQKEKGRGDFRKIPNGLPGIETRLLLLWKGVVEGKLTPNRFVELCSTAPAKIFGLYPRKGTLAPGADADLLLWDPKRRVELSANALHMRVDYSPYEGMVVEGGPAKVFAGGRLIVDGDRFLGKPGDGRYLRRSVPTK